MEDFTLTGIFVIGVVGAVVGGVIGQYRNRVVEGVIGGFFFGPIAWLLLLFGPDTRRKCGQCLGAVPATARVCCHCGRDLPAPYVEPVTSRAPIRAPAPLPPRDPDAEYLREREECPACGMLNPVTRGQLRTGLRCARCQVGFVPRPEIVI